MSTTTVVLIVIVVLLVFYFISVFNRLVRLKNNRENAFANIDVQLKQRHDLIPQLVSTVKGYASHEQNTLTSIVNARNQAVNAKTIDEKIDAENNLSGALNGVRLLVEAYPDLKADKNFMHLQEEIADIENKLAASRRFFNSATKEYNTSMQVFPANLVASMFGHHTEKMFNVDANREQVEQAPVINF